MPSPITILYAVFFFQIIALVKAKQHFWSELVYFQGQLASQDYVKKLSIKTNSSVKGIDLNKGLFSLQILSDNTFVFKINTDNTAQTIKGQIWLNNKISLIERQYELVSEQSFTGTVSYEIGYGINWKYSLKLNSYNINIQRQQVKYSYLAWILLLGFVSTGLISIPINDKQRNRLLYNFQKRIHPLSLVLILIKLISIFCCFVSFAYQSITTLSIWSIILIYGIYIFCLAPSIIHFLYLLSSFQKALNRLFEAQRKKEKNILMIAAVCSVFLVSIFLFYIPKGIILYYILSLANVIMYLHACRIKKYAYGQIIIYDASLTAVLTIISLFIPVMNYNLISFKQTVLFWNYYIFLFLLGFVIMKKIILYEQPEQVQISQNQADQHQAQIAMSQNNSKPQSIQIIQ